MCRPEPLSILREIHKAESLRLNVTGIGMTFDAFQELHRALWDDMAPRVPYQIPLRFPSGGRLFDRPIVEIPQGSVSLLVNFPEAR